MTITRPTLSAEQRAMAFEAIEAVIAEIDLAAESIIQSCSIGISADRTTMDDEYQAEYERLITVSRRARCALTLLKIGT